MKYAVASGNWEDQTQVTEHIEALLPELSAEVKSLEVSYRWTVNWFPRSKELAVDVVTYSENCANKIVEKLNGFMVSAFKVAFLLHN